MTLIGTNTFGGEQPRVSPRLLATNMGQVARVARLMSGDLEAWNDLVTTVGLTSAVNTVYAMDIGSGAPKWLYFTDSQLDTGAVEIDIARGPIPGDTDERTYLTGLDAPRWTDLTNATSVVGPATHAPYKTFLLGVPAPTVAPTLELTTTTLEAGEIKLTNPGAESGSVAGWTIRSGDLGIKAVADITGLSGAAGSYVFYGGNNASGKSTQTLVLADTQVIANQSLTLKWKQGSGAHNSKASMELQYFDADGNANGSKTIATSAPGLTMVNRSFSDTTPADTSAVRVAMVFENVGGGETDAYIDDIHILSTGGSATWDGSSLSDWTVFQSTSGSTIVTVSDDMGWPAPSFRFQSVKDRVTGIQRNMAISRTTAMTIEFDYWTKWSGDDDGVPLGIVIGADSLGEGTGILFNQDDTRAAQYPKWEQGPVTTNQLVAGNIAENARNHVTIELTKLAGKSFRANITVVNVDASTTPVVCSTTIPINGDFLGFKGQNSAGNIGEGYLDNISVTQTLTDAADTEIDTTLTNYVFVWVNSNSELSAPSPVSRSVQVTEQTVVTVTTPTTAPAGYNIDRKQIFRAAIDGSGYRFVGEIPASQSAYDDSKADADLGEILESEDWDAPPADLRGLIALPNGVLAGFRENELCVSVQNRPHAWPVVWRMTTDYPIVSIAAMDTDIIVATQANPYIVSGADPSALQMAKLEKPQGCVSKRSMVTMDGMGVVYASPDGITVVSRGSVEVATTGLFTREQWQALKPESIHGVAHDGRYYFWYDTGTVQGGYILDAQQGGFGLVELDFYARATYANPLTDSLYMVIGTDLKQWNAAGTKRSYLWRSKMFEMPKPTSFECAQIRALGDGDLTARFYADGSDTPYYTKTYASNVEFMLPDVECQDSIEVELEGTLRVRSIMLGETMAELP